MTRILVSGASVAGPALAWWLRRYGFEPTVVERAPAPRDGGQAIDLRGAAREVAERMGIMSDIRRAHTGTCGMSLVDDAGGRLASMGADLLGDSGGAIAEVEILRGDLVRILHEVTRDDVEYIFEDSVAAFSQRESGVEVAFERCEPRTFDLVAGADGVHSNVRRLAFGEESDFVRDLGAYVAIFTAPNRLDLGGWKLMHNAPPGRTAGLYPMRKKTEAKAMFFFASEPLNYDRRDSRLQKEIVARAFSGVGGPPAARGHVGSPRLLLRQGRTGPHGELVKRACGARRGRGLLPLADVWHGHEPGPRGSLRAGRGAGGCRRRLQRGVRPLRERDARVREAGPRAGEGRLRVSIAEVATTGVATKPVHSDAALHTLEGPRRRRGSESCQRHNAQGLPGRVRVRATEAAPKGGLRQPDSSEAQVPTRLAVRTLAGEGEPL